MNPKLTIVGCGWHAHVVAELAELTGKYSQIQLLDRDWPTKTIWGDWAVVGGFDVLEHKSFSSTDEFFVALGDNGARVTLCVKIVGNGKKLATLIHPHAFVSPRSKLQPGTVICAGAIVQPYADIGMGCIVNTAATVDHHCVLGDGVHLSPGVHLSGNVRIGKSTWLGTGASVRDKLTIGDNVTIGVGSVVVKDICEAGIYCGVPARKIKKIN
jgi:sugar O-acyltransferase (sialic acid O-acetyltransferase NeuD family)